MTQVDNSISQPFELKPEEVAQLDNLLHLLVELKIIEPPEQFFSGLPSENNDERYVPEEIELLQISPVPLDVCEAYLESALNSPESIPNLSPVAKDKLEEPVEMIATFEEKFVEEGRKQEAEDIIASAFPDKSNLDNSEDAFQKLQEILVGAKLAELNDLAAKIAQNFSKLEHQIYDPQELIKLLLPSISELLRLKISESKEEIAQVFTPIIDQAIRSRTEQDKISMSEALAPAVPLAISQQIIVAPEEVSDAIAPAMGRAIKKQIEIEQNIIVDALYPIIGSTIAKYMAETIRAINQQVEETLSVEGIKRKIRAKLQGVSEAELILKGSLTFTIKAIFLIHKTSGLVISDIQHSDAEQLESEMVAGMLTAIRSFANDCINQSGNVSELDAIDYGTSKIILEVAGYCYLAIVVQGEPSKKFIGNLRKTLAKIVQDYGDLIAEFDGNPDTIPREVHSLLEVLRDTDAREEQKKSKPTSLLVLSLTLIGVILIPWGFWQYHIGVIRAIENKTSLALASTPELAVYRLTVQVEHDKLKLTGQVPNQFLHQKAEEIVRETSPKWSIDNQILSVEVPADPILAAAEVKRITAVLNQMDGTAISAEYIAGKIAIEGTVNRIADAHTITHAFEQIPGVKSVTSTVRVQRLQIEVRFYFKPDSAKLRILDLGYKIQQIKIFLNQHPNKHLKIVGYSYDYTDENTSQQLALKRAKAVQQALIDQGVNPSRLQIMGKINFPPGIDVNQPSWLSRCVIIEAI